MIVKCPHCGGEVMVNGLGRRPLNIPLTNVCESLRRHHSVSTVSQELHCSQAYVFKVLKANGLKLNDIINARRRN